MGQLVDDRARENEPLFRNYYACPECGYHWVDEYECEVDDECPECGTSAITPEASIELDRETGDQLDPNERPPEGYEEAE